MTDKFYTCVLKAGLPVDVTSGAAATGGNAFDFRVTYDAAGVSKIDALKALDAIQYKIIQDTWPPT